MRLNATVILLLLTSLILLAGCSSSEPTPDIEATVEAKVKAILASTPTQVSYPTPGKVEYSLFLKIFNSVPGSAKSSAQENKKTYFKEIDTYFFVVEPPTKADHPYDKAWQNKYSKRVESFFRTTSRAALLKEVRSKVPDIRDALLQWDTKGKSALGNMTDTQIGYVRAFHPEFPGSYWSSDEEIVRDRIVALVNLYAYGHLEKATMRDHLASMYEDWMVSGYTTGEFLNLFVP